MSGMLAACFYLVAMGLPLYLLFHYHSRAWYWHALAIVAAISFGFIPIPSQMENPLYGMVFGFVFISLLIWGVCGLLLFHWDHEEHHGKHHGKHA